MWMHGGIKTIRSRTGKGKKNICTKKKTLSTEKGENVLAHASTHFLDKSCAREKSPHTPSLLAKDFPIGADWPSL